MPTLKQLTCQIELAGSNVPMREYQTCYGDGFVETFVAVPSPQTRFSIHLTSQGYIAAGIGMFIFMDGVYQCNRYRNGLIIPTNDSPNAMTEVDLRVRQKEEAKGGGHFIGRDWTFEKLNTSAPENNSNHHSLFCTDYCSFRKSGVECKPRHSGKHRHNRSRSAALPGCESTRSRAVKVETETARQHTSKSQESHI